MRDLDTVLEAELNAPVIEQVIMVALTFRSGTEYACSAGFNIVWNGQTYLGLGTLASISAVQEGTEIRADGLSLTLSGIDKKLLQDTENDVLPLAPAKVYYALVRQGKLVGTPYLLFGGVVDAPEISVGVDTFSITLKLESRMALLNRASQRRYTSADQHANGYSDDTGFDYVPRLQNIAFRFGS